MSESLVRYGDLPYDFRVLIEQMIENDDSKLAIWMQYNRDVVIDATLPVHELSVADCWQVVREWDPCFERGEPHIQQMIESMKEGETLPPILHESDGLPVDGRHRITAAHRLNIDGIDSINLDEIKMAMKKLRYRQKKEASPERTEEGSIPG